MREYDTVPAADLWSQNKLAVDIYHSLDCRVCLVYPPATFSKHCLINRSSEGEGDILRTKWGDVRHLPQSTCLDDDGRLSLNPSERLKTPTAIPVISTLPVTEFVSYEIGRGDSSVVKLFLDSKSRWTAVKTSFSPRLCRIDSARSCHPQQQWKHPFIVEFRGYLCDPYNHNSTIVTEFAGNGSLANHLSPTECSLIWFTLKLCEFLLVLLLRCDFDTWKVFIHRNCRNHQIELRSRHEIVSDRTEIERQSAELNDILIRLPGLTTKERWANVDKSVRRYVSLWILSVAFVR
jgi:hypothetical protein